MVVLKYASRESMVAGPGASLHLPAASTVEQVEALLPWNLKAMLDEQKKEQHRQLSAA
jgi:hypothetical protein